MRLATYNVEWFDALFDDAARPIREGLAARRGLLRTRQWDALGAVFRAVDADAVLVIEAPDISRRRDGLAALRAFAAEMGLSARDAVAGFPNDTQQEIALLYDPDVLAVRHDPLDVPEAPRFDGQFRIDLDVDDREDRVRFSKPPLELALRAGGRDIRLIGAHLKSKAPHGAKNQDDLMRLALAARRKHLAQSVWLRRRIDGHLARSEPLVVMGDFNDGPGLDAFETLFGRSGVEIVAGEGEGALVDPSIAATVDGSGPTSARFERPGGWLTALLDYAMVSPDIAATGPAWRIWHPLEDARLAADPPLRDALLAASDHFPVTLDFDPARLGDSMSR